MGRVIGTFEEGGPVSIFANQIPGINAVAGMHDVFQVSMGTSILRKVLNFPGMLVAGVATYAGFVGQMMNSNLRYMYIPIGGSDDNRKSRYILVSAGG